MTEVGYYLVTLEGVPEGGVVPGAPTLTLSLGVNAVTGQINGSATITQAVTPPNGHVEFPVSGVMHHTGFGEDQLLVSLSGQYVVSVPPPAIGSYLAHFTASLVVDKSWNGTGTYTYGNQTMSHVKITNTSA